MAEYCSSFVFPLVYILCNYSLDIHTEQNITKYVWWRIAVKQIVNGLTQFEIAEFQYVCRLAGIIIIPTLLKRGIIFEINNQLCVDP